jgi:hypothetical protein
VLAAALCAAAVSGCGSSSAKQSVNGASSTPASSGTPTPTTPGPSSTAPTGPTPTALTSSAAPAATVTGPKSASCVNGWVQPAPGTDFYKQAVAALEQSVGGTGYDIKSVRYFAGPLAAGGIGAIYYLDVRDPRLTSRVVLVSGAGPSSVAVAKTGTTGWNPADWTARGGGASPVTLLPSVAGCLAGA